MIFSRLEASYAKFPPLPNKGPMIKGKALSLFPIRSVKELFFFVFFLFSSFSVYSLHSISLSFEGRVRPRKGEKSQSSAGESERFFGFLNFLPRFSKFSSLVLLTTKMLSFAYSFQTQVTVQSVEIL